MQSYIFDFKKSTSLMKKWNKEFDVEDIEGTTFYIALVDSICDDNFSDCIDANNQLKYSGNNVIKSECELTYVTNETSESIVLNNDCTFDFDGTTYPEFFNMKGAFLITDTNYVLGYSINQYSLRITTQMIFEKDLVFFDITEGVFNGE